MADIITSAELTSYLRIDPSTDVALFVELANGLVSEAITDAGLTIPTTVPTKIRTITLEVAGRPVRNPQGFASEQADDYAYRRDAGTAAAGVYLTDDELEALIGAVGVRVLRAGTIPITSTWDTP